MGDGRSKQTSPGIADDIAAGTFDPNAVIGKRTLTGDLDAPSGDQFLDHGATCAHSVRQDCFLSSEQREHLITDYKIRVAMANDAYQRALDAIRVDKLLENDESKLPLIATILLDVVGAHALSALTSALQALRAAQLKDLGRIVNLDPDAVGRSTAAASMTYLGLSMTTEKQLASLSKEVWDKGKEQAVSALKGQLDQEKVDAKQAALSYIARLQQMATSAFEDLRLKPAGTATDAQLLVLWNGFDPNQHTANIYKVALDAKVARYAQSGVTDIGRGEAFIPDETRQANDVLRMTDRGTPWTRDTVVVRLKFKSGYPDRYAYAARDWAFDMVGNAPVEHVNDEQKVPLDQSKWSEREIPIEARRNARPEFVKLIDEEFVGVAVERHLQVWGKDPDSLDVDDSTWTWDKERAQKARDNKARASGPFGMPRLQLGNLAAPPAPVVVPDELKLKNGTP